MLEPAPGYGPDPAHERDRIPQADPYGRAPPKLPAVVDAEVYPDEDNIYEVERLLDRRIVRRGRSRTPFVEYLVRWKGYSAEDDQWVRKSDLAGSEDLVEEYERTYLSDGST